MFVELSFSFDLVSAHIWVETNKLFRLFFFSNIYSIFEVIYRNVSITNAYISNSDSSYQIVTSDKGSFA